ncbi:ABC transporter ATP-binding protein [Halosimplex litoreum]|uniref:ABC transporter ATP-binding protein n=1 Tax=Halosimplex litoreum TaxID=1198301 RepID=A0A7T3FYY8_9EURY|nr:ABC transporter ATP-binding protein [Halosimplex litoreum]QPV63212.1 ABC transporter ATP-binding protein [Halosimplex litoreum]
MSDELPIRDKLRALYRVALYRPAFSTGILLVSFFAAVLEGIGLSFLLPIIELARDPAAVESADGILRVFVTAYEVVGLPLTLETVVVGVAVVMTLRYTSSFLVHWLRAALRTDYVRELQTMSFERALDAEVSYFDQQGSDEILNAIVTQASYAGRVIQRIIRFVEQGLLSLIYLGVALYLAPGLTVAAAIVLGLITFVLRSVVESGYDIGSRVAEANERLQTAAQAGTQGVRDVKLFGMTGELFSDFHAAADQVAGSQIKLRRNEAALDNIYQLLTAITVFVLIYAALAIASMSLASLGVFLFAMFRLAPRVSTLNNIVYQIESDLPHLARTQSFIDELDARRESVGDDAPVPNPVDTVDFQGVEFSYDTGEQIFDGLSFSADRGEFVAFVGPSGAGKSTVVSLLTRMYEPDDGRILADGRPIDEMDVDEWRERVSVVRQHPYIFNDTLRANVTVADRQASRREIERVCEIAQVTEFLNDLPNGYETQLGDDGVRLSGGQKQRVALARALLKDADFLVLDEATSDLDSNIEETVHQAIEAMDRDYAMFVIAHRLSTIVNADRIYTVEDGEISETGTHTELVEDDGTYADLYVTQAQSN